MMASDGVAYDFDPGANKSVSVSAIHGLVESSAYTNTTLLAGGLLQSFDIQQDDIDRLEGILDEPQLEEAVESDSDAESEEEETPALARSR
jgi:hypothetical protein